MLPVILVFIKPLVCNEFGYAVHVKVRPEHKEKVIISQDFGSIKFDLIYMNFSSKWTYCFINESGCFEAIFSIYAIHE